MPCYPGPNPVDQNDPKGLRRAAIWKWAKANGIDHGMSFDQIHDAINNHFFAGQAKPEWIHDILSGRKTPFRQVANDAWKKQYNRRQSIQQAKDVMREQAMHPAVRALKRMWDVPRGVAVFGHGIVFPVTHAGDLALRPASWGTFFKGLINTYEKAFNFKGGDAAVERMMSSLKKQPLYDTALRSGLDLNERISNVSGTSKMSSRAWSALTMMRFELWNHQMEKLVRPSMDQAQVLDIGKNMAEWANHATGSGKGPIGNLGGNWIFGPKLTQSKLNRIFSDPIKTVKTFSNWSNASPGEKAAAWTRLSGGMQYFGTGIGMLAVNQGVLAALGQKDKINFTDPTKSDWLAFKGGGLEWSIPGMYSELKTLGNILAVSFENSKDINKLTHGSKQMYIAQKLGQYALSKANPAIGVGKEIITGQDFLGRPLPWSSQKGTPSLPRYNGVPGLSGWDEYLLSHGPIPLTGPIRYAYDQLRARGSSAQDALGVTKALILYGAEPKGVAIGAVGATGMHVRPDYAAAKAQQKAAHALMKR